MDAAYQRIADDIARLINSGHIAAGSQLPSVRELAAQRGVSATTAVSALRVLEQRQLAEARPRLGYFARRAPAPMAEPQFRPPQSHSRAVRISDVITQMFPGEAPSPPRAAPLGAALPDPELLPIQALQKATARLARTRPKLLSGYGPLDGSLRLRRWLVAHYLRCETELDPSELLITNGGMEALELALGAVCQPGDSVAVESPCYFGFLQVLETLKLKACEVRTHPRSGLSVEALAEVLQAPGGERIKACLLCPTVSNPLGATLPDADKQALVALCQRYGVALVEDDLYGDLHYAAQRPRPLRHFDARAEVIVCGSFSKTLAPGARVGYIAAGHHVERVRALKFATSVSTAPLLQAALAEVLEGAVYVRHMRRLRQACQDQVEQVMGCITEHFPPETRVVQPSGGFLLWLQLPAGSNSLEIYRAAISEGLEFAPGALFSASGQGFADSLRLNCGHRITPAMQAAVARLGALCRQHLAQSQSASHSP